MQITLDDTQTHALSYAVYRQIDYIRELAAAEHNTTDRRALEAELKALQSIREQLLVPANV